MAETTADLLVDRLIDWGVDTVFGLPGDGINGIMEALRKRRDRVRFIHVRHEESAAFMACAHAKYTGRLGVCLATSGPGGIHLLNGLYDAKLDKQPVLAITGMPFHDLIGTHTQQDVPLDKLFMDVAAYSERVMGPAHVENVTDLACRYATEYRTVAHLTIPVDIQDQAGAKRSQRNVPGHTSDTRVNGGMRASDGDMRRAAEILNSGKRVAILAGAGALGATDELEAAAEMLGAPIVKPLLGKAAVPDDSDYTTGPIGLLGTTPSQDVMERCDTLFMVGTSFPYIEFLPKPDRARAIQIEIDPMRVGLRYPVEVGLVGDSRTTLRALLPLLQRHRDRSFLEDAQRGMREWRDLMRERASREDMPMKPQVVAHHLGELLRSDAIISSDSGTIATWFARHIQVKRGQMHSLSGTLATMANGLPYTIAAQLAYPDRQCVAFVGDGGFAMLMAEFATAVKYELPIKVIVMRNNTLGQIKWEQMVFLGNPEYGCDLNPIDFAKYAEACGGKGFHVEDPKECRAALEAALSAKGPVIVDAVVDPYEPPMPGKVTIDQAKKMGESLIRGEPDREQILKTIMEDRLREIV